jgi:hypothetical protein
MHKRQNNSNKIKKLIINNLLEVHASSVPSGLVSEEMLPNFFVA